MALCPCGWIIGRRKTFGVDLASLDAGDLFPSYGSMCHEVWIIGPKNLLISTQLKAKKHGNLVFNFVDAVTQMLPQKDMEEMAFLT
ncbi:hypothetical protein L596_019185 [Steinernema carpocapsae]|uniref:Uncharacterized protein n=1 Tax=Steinernema carpocapsae TaxID=34508 RepID=A0A4U5MPH4_STECR|nr:hypothetical protein L596_019185 [Steinernema carpocapsae]